MPIHDQYLRTTPWEHLLPDPDFPDRHFAAIQESLARHPVAEDDPGAFALLESTRRALVEIRDPDEGSEDAGHTHALLLFHAFHLHRQGLPHLLATVPVSRWAVEGEAPETGEPAGTAFPGSVYVQLPQHLFWIREDAEERPLSLDGFFWTVRGETVHVLGVGGVGVGGGAAPGGFRVLPLPGVPVAEAPVWLSETMREEGEDFRSEIPGAELEGLYELRTAGELLKLASRMERFLARFPEGVEEPPSHEGEPGTSGGEGEQGAPVPGRPRYRRLVLVR